MRVFVAGAAGVIGAEVVPTGQMPVVGGTGIWSFTEVTDGATASVAAVTRDTSGIYDVVEAEAFKAEEAA